MIPTRKPIEPWSRDELIRAVTVMLKIAGWAFALVWAAYIIRFSGVPAALHSFVFGTETLEQVNAAKAAWGQLGDFIGGTLNPLVSVLTLIGLLFTVLLQQEAMLQVRDDSTRSHEALTVQAELALTAARLNSLAAALDVTTELHRQAVVANHMSAINLLTKKEQISGQIMEINDRLNRPKSSGDV